MADGLLRTSGGFGLLETPTEEERNRMMGSALSNAAMMVAQANQRGGMGLGGLLGMAGGGFAQGMRQAEQDFRRQQLEDFQIQQQKAAADLAAQEGINREAFIQTLDPSQQAAARGAPHHAAQAAFAKPEGLGFGTSYKGNALEIYNALVEKPNRTPLEDRQLNQAYQILTQATTVATPQGTYIQPGLSLGGGAPAAAAQTPMGQQVAGQPGQPPGFVPKAVSGEQAMRTALAPATLNALDNIERIANSEDYLQTYAQVRSGLVPDWIMTEPARELEFNINLARENILRALTGAAAPEAEVERVGRLLMPPPGSEPEEIRARIKTVKDIMRQYVTLAAPGQNLIPEQQPAQGIQALNIGTVRKGYRYKGGDPSQQSSWEKVP